MKFLVDAQLPPFLAEWLRATGGEATHVEEAGLRNAVDSAIREYAVSQGYVLITNVALRGYVDCPVTSQLVELAQPAQES